jgi:putative ABC transport system substrate-binding protein
LRSNRFEAFFQGLRDLGYVDGQTITIEYMSAEGRGERFATLATECVRLKADIIAVSTTPGGASGEERNSHDPDCYARTWRSSGDWARR